MDIHGFHVVSKLDADSKEGFSTTVTHPDQKQIRGPFDTIKAAVKCAQGWNLEDPDAARREAQAREKAAVEQAMADQAAKADPPVVIPAEKPDGDKSPENDIAHTTAIQA